MSSSLEANSRSDIQEFSHFNGTRGLVTLVIKSAPGPHRQPYGAIQYPQPLVKIHINIILQSTYIPSMGSPTFTLFE